MATNQIGASGLTIASKQDVIDTLVAGIKVIFGIDVNVAPDSPDGQLINIFAQANEDALELVMNVNAMFDPDQAIGDVLDQRCAINGIQRQQGTQTVTDVTIVTDAALSLFGADQSTEQIYTVADNAGTQWELITTQHPVGAGAHVYAFQAVNPGAVTTIPNTITVPVSIVIGVTSINNPTTYTTLGLDEETDAELKIRRQKSVSGASQGYLAALLAALENINGVTVAQVYENNTGITDGDGITGHSIWVIVGGSGAAASIANAIYTKRNAGAGMVGAQTYSITQADGTVFTVLWDVVTTQALFAKATLTSLDGVNAPDIAAIRAGLVTSFAPELNETVNVNQLATLIQVLDPNSLVTSPGFSAASGGSYTNTLAPTAKNFQFIVSAADIILLPVVLSVPNGVTTVLAGVVTVTLSIAHGGSTAQFTALGGFGTITWSKFSGNGAIDSVTGIYTSAAAGAAVIRGTDSLGNIGSCTVTIT